MQSGPDVVVRGAVRRARSESAVSNLYGGLAVFMAAIVVFGVVTRDAPPIVIGVGGCAAFAGIALLMRRLRGPLLVLQAEELEVLLTSALCP